MAYKRLLANENAQLPVLYGPVQQRPLFEFMATPSWSINYKMSSELSGSYKMPSRGAHATLYVTVQSASMISLESSPKLHTNSITYCITTDVQGENNSI